MKKFISIFMIIIFTFSSVGCKQTKHEISLLAVVLAMGIDLTREGKYLVTTQIFNPQKRSSSPSSNEMNHGRNSNSEIVIFSATGDSPQNALSEMSTELGKTLFFGHNKFVVIGKGLAEAGLSLFIDTTLRNAATRPDYPLFITTGTASEIMMALTSDETLPSTSIENLIKQQTSMGFAPIISRIDFANALTSPTATPIAGVISLSKNHIDATFRLAGTAVFKKDKLIGFLDTHETRGMQWIKGKASSGTITTVTENNQPITFSILNLKNKVKSIVSGDSVKMQVLIKIESNITELSDTFDPMKNYKVMDELGKIQDLAVEKEVKLALHEAQKNLCADVFDFGSIIYREHPSFWKQIQDDWERIFPNIKVEVKVDSSIKRPGNISKPMK